MEQEIRVIKCFNLSNTVGIKLRNTLVDSSRLLVGGRACGNPWINTLKKIMSMTSTITCEFFGGKFVLISNQTNTRTMSADC